MTEAGGIAGLDAFRAEVRAFFDEALDPDLRRKVLGGFELTREESIGWHRRLHARGWAAPHWPVALGGADWDIARQFAYEEEAALGGAPIVHPMGVGVVGPMLIAEGTQDQKDRFLPPMLSGEEFWCQGFSEPGAGSDLASLQCAAVREGDSYVVNGSKIWTTFGHWADWCLVLVRTDPGGRPQTGITILMVDMKTPGVELRPIPTLDGLHVLNQLFFTDVAVPVAMRLGAEGDGWSILKRNIGLERIFNGGPAIAKALRRRLMALAAQPDADGRRPLDAPWFRDRLARIDVRLTALEAVTRSALAFPDPAVRPEASLLKVRGTELQQDITRLITQVAGYDGLAYDRDAVRDGWRDGDEAARRAPLVPHYLFMRKASISSGTNEVQRDIIARHLLGPVRS